jgi:hypothetical protein
VSSILDNTSPDPPVVSGTTPTNNQIPTWTWVNPTGSSNIRYQLDAEADGFWIITGGTITESYTHSSNLNTGNHTLYVQASDDLGNWSDSGSHMIQIDITPPTVEAGSNITWTDVQANLDGTASDETVLIYQWEKTSGTGTVNIGDVNSLSTTIFGIDGEEANYTIQLTATDAVGYSTSDSLNFYWDKKGPTPGNSGTLSFTNVQTNSLTLNWNIASDLSTSSSALMYKVVGSTADNIGTIESAQLTDNGRFVVQDWTSNISSVNVGSLATGGSYYFNVLVKDSLENIYSYISNNQSLTGDPGISITLNVPTDETITFDQSNNLIVNQTSTLNVSVIETFDSYEWSCYGLDLSMETGSSASIDCNLLDPGVHRLTVYITEGGIPYSNTLQFIIQN